ncbi:MAG: hypothetical protein L0Y54_00970 [Sporichthyaceae bacterium]|nr:hypothetical protein [Sporichthyaceae bacterium]
MTMLDNYSRDAGLSDLRAAAAELGARFERSRWPIDTARVNTHGDVLRDFVRNHSDAGYFLFVDADIVFEEVGTVWTMQRELTAQPDVWAVQARFRNYEEEHGNGASLDIAAGRGQRVWWRFEPVPPGDHQMETERFTGTDQKRCHTACTLVANSTRFRTICNSVGLSCALIISEDAELAGLYDTLGLASRVMTTHGLRYVLSEASVTHFFGMSYRPRHEVAVALEDCRRRLSDLRSTRPGHGLAED